MDRRALLKLPLAALAGVGAPAALASRVFPTDGVSRFTIRRAGEAVGEHRIAFSREGGGLVVRSESALAVALGEDAGTIEEVYEPFLIQEGFLQRTPRGRVATQRAYEHLGIRVPPGTSGRLF